MVGVKFFPESFGTGKTYGPLDKAQNVWGETANVWKCWRGYDTTMKCEFPIIKCTSGLQEVVAWPLVKPRTAGLEYNNSRDSEEVHGWCCCWGQGTLTLSWWSKYLILTPGCLQVRGGSQSSEESGRGCRGKKRDRNSQPTSWTNRLEHHVWAHMLKSVRCR